MSDQRPNTIPWPPLIYIAAIILAVALHFLFPLPWIGRPLSDFLFAGGLVLAAVAIAMDLMAMRAMRRANTTVAPHKRSDHLVTSGPFAFSRNPIYLGNTALMAGFGFIFGIVWFLPLAFAAAWLTQKLAIEREERHLESRFGKAYRDYRKHVRRWV